MLLTLTPHPDTPCDAVKRIEVEVVRTGLGIPTLSIIWRAFGDMTRLAVPPPISGRADGLWRSTCFEAFVRVGGESKYLELNVSPSDGWATYEFDGYREGMRPSATPMAVERWGSTDDVQAEADLDLDDVFAGSHRGRPLHIGLSAVIEEIDGGVSYWALAHPSGKPDFHHPDSFATTLEPA